MIEEKTMSFHECLVLIAYLNFVIVPKTMVNAKNI